jgi:hypothetical protein
MADKEKTAYQRRRGIFRPGGGLRCERARVLPACLGIRSAQGERYVVHRPDPHRAGMPCPWHGEPCRSQRNDQLESFTLALARRIATRPAIGLKLAKQAVNFSMDLQGQQQALTGTLVMHHVGHAHARIQFGYPVDPAGLAVIRDDAKATLREKQDREG